jgi:outer membrane protein OmpA-like peptidoglycan-associated protein
MLCRIFSAFALIASVTASSGVPASAAEPRAAVASHEGSAMVFFRFNSAVLTPLATANLTEFARHYPGGSQTKVRIVGIVNGSGLERRARRLNEKRVIAVRDFLIGHGISASVISTDANGKPRIPTLSLPGERRPSQRRVEVYFE